MIILYIGDGKGKTTAAMGAVARACGYAWPIYVAQFMKSEEWPSGERAFFTKQVNITFETLGEGFYQIQDDRKDPAVHQNAARVAYQRAADALHSGDYRLIVFDEILTALDDELLTEDDILALMRARPHATTLIMTGHRDHPRITASADLVTDMRKVKHPFDDGHLAVKGIDF
jgi:cob(I)alamin adenosyltransferase